MKNLGKSISLMSTLILLLFAVETLQAQHCGMVTMYKSSGQVLSAKKGERSVNSTANRVQVKIRKTGGRAQTDVRVYVDGQLINTNLNFANGNYTSDWRTHLLTNVMGKNIMVQVDNRSVGHTFSYDIELEGNTNSLMFQGEPYDWSIGGSNNRRTLSMRQSCTGRAKISITARKRGNYSMWLEARPVNASTVIPFENGQEKIQINHGYSSRDDIFISYDEPFIIVVRTSGTSAGQPTNFTLNAEVVPVVPTAPLKSINQ
jgi:ribosomal protein S6E (S10)